MLEFHKYFYNKIKNIMDLLTLSVKFMLGFGVLCLILYLFKIGYFPTEVTVGDSLVFFFISFSFSVIYIIFIMSNFALGFIVYLLLRFLLISISPKLLLNYIISHYNYWSIKVNFQFFKSLECIELLINIFSSIFLILLSFLILLIYSIDPLNVLLISGVSFLTYLLLSLFHNEYNKTKNEAFYKGVIIIPENQIEHYKEKHVALKNQKMIMCLIFGLATPLWGYFFDKENAIISSYSVNAITVNKKDSALFIHKDYAELIPKEFIVEKNQFKDYLRVIHVDVLLKGIGKNALLEFNFRNGDKLRREIPNESILIETHKSKK